METIILIVLVVLVVLILISQSRTVGGDLSSTESSE